MNGVGFQPEGLGERLRIARTAVGLTTREAVDLLGEDCHVSHVMLAKYERGLVIPPLGVLAALANIYRRHLKWFLAEAPRLIGVRYRNAKSKVRQGDRTWFEANAQRWLEAYLRLEQRIEKPLKSDVKLPAIAPSDDPAKVAGDMRKALGIKADAPIPSVIECIERCGVRVIEIPTELQIDGIAGRFGDELVVVLNPSANHDRSRMNAAHEWGHGLFGHCNEPAGVVSDEQENVSYEFASHFIIPTPQLRDAFRGESMVRLVKFKEMFGVSLAAMIFRAEKANILSARTAKHLWIEFAKRGWRKSEPGHVRADRATRFEQLLEGAITNGAITWRDAESVTGIPSDELNHRLRLAMGLDKGEFEGDSQEEAISLKFKEPQEPN